MLALSILIIFALVVVAIIAIEIRNERKYQASRRKSGRQPKSKKEKKKAKLAEEETEKKAAEEEPKSPHKSFQMTRRPKTKEVEEEKPLKKTKKLPPCTYPKFTHVRLVEMGLSDDEANAFVLELIPQLEAELPKIEALLEVSDFVQLERVTHGIKGSTTNLGTGGVSDLLVEYNTYLKTERDLEIATVYFESLKHYINELKNQYH